MLDQILKCILNAETGLGTDRHGLAGFDTDDLLNFILHALGLCLGKVHLIEDG